MYSEVTPYTNIWEIWHCMLHEIYSSMVRIRMSAGLYPPRMSVIQTMVIRMRYPSPWARLSSEIHKNWKLVIQEIEQPRLKQALQVKRDDAVHILLGSCVG